MTAALQVAVARLVTALRPPRPRSVVAGVRGMISRHRVFTVALLGGAVVRLVAMLGYRPVLWFTGDSYFYAAYTLKLRPAPTRTAGYPLLLKLLEPFHSWTLVALVQHAMGLGVAVMLYALLLRARLPKWGCALAAVPVLYDGYQIEFEHLVMSETLFTFLLMAAVTVVLWREGRLPVGVGVLVGALLAWAVLVRSAGVGAVPVVLGCLLLRRAGVRVIAATTAAFALPIVGYAFWFQSANGTFGLTSSDGLYLWGRTTSFADCAKIKPPPDEQRLCLTTPVGRRQAPGTIIWRNVPARHLPGGPTDPANNALLRSFSLHAIEAQPVDYLWAVTKGTARAFSPRRYHYPNRPTEELYHFPASPHRFPAKTHLNGMTPLRAVKGYGRENPSQVVRPYASVMRGYQAYISLPGPLLFVIFVAGAAGLLRRAAPRSAVLTAWGVATALLVFPVATADFDYRYVLPAVPFACLAAGLAFASLRERRATAPLEQPSEAVAA